MLNERTKLETIKFAQELVRIKSLSGEEKEVADLIKNKMIELGFDEVFMDRYGDIVGKIRGSDSTEGCKKVLFDGHMDTVDVGDGSKWRHDPYGAEIVDDKMFGRGTCDMKTAISALLYAFKDIDRNFSGEIYISASVGEEIMEGYAFYEVLQKIKPNYVILAEPTDLNINRGHRGRAGIVLTAEGKTAHTAQPEMGINAVYRIISAIQSVSQMKLPEDKDLGKGSIELLDIVSRPFPSLSQVPDRCVARFDRRVVVGETQQTVINDMRGVIKNIEGTTVSYNKIPIHCYTGEIIDALDFRPGWVFPKSHEIVVKSRHSLEKIGIKPKIQIARYCTNGSASGGLLDIPTIVFGPGSNALHVIDEYIEIDKLLKSVEGFNAIASGLLE